MYISQLIAALSLEGNGVEFHVKANHVAYATLYQPYLRGEAETLDKAAIVLGRQMISHSECPQRVLEALLNVVNTWSLYPC